MIVNSVNKLFLIISLLIPILLSWQCKPKEPKEFKTVSLAKMK